MRGPDPAHPSDPRQETTSSDRRRTDLRPDALDTVQGVTTNRQPSPPGKATAPEEYESWDDYMADLELAETLWIDAEAQRGLKAMRLAPSLAICRALLAGQNVPRESLDPRWVKRYGL